MSVYYGIIDSCKIIIVTTNKIKRKDSVKIVIFVEKCFKDLKKKYTFRNFVKQNLMWNLSLPAYLLDLMMWNYSKKIDPTVLFLGNFNSIKQKEFVF